MSKNMTVFIALIAMSPLFLAVWTALCLGTERVMSWIF